MHDTLGFLAVVVAAFFVAGFVKGVIGLGLPTVGIGLLGLWMTPAEGAAIVLLPAIVTNIWQCTHGGGVAQLLRRMAPLLTGIAVGTLLGAAYLPSANSGDATTWLGAALALYAALGLSRIHFSVPRHLEPWLSPVIGLANGAITVATGVFAIPQVPYIHSLHFDRDKLVQAMGLSFTTSTIAMAAALGHAGTLRADLALPSVAALVAGLAGMPLGRIVRGKVRPETFRLWFFAGLLLLGLHLALQRLV
ncbi:MAG: sulfite exporter TauE/SafE family protein [Pseudolabrys sp.]